MREDELTMSKIALIVASEKLDKLFPAITLATTAAVSGWDADLFFTFWGLLALKKGYEPSGVSLDYQDYSMKMKDALASGAIPGWRELLEQGRATGNVRVYACSSSLGMFGMKEEDLEAFVDGVAGASTFLGMARDADVSLFIS
jgi:peroxiredoxin family protein